MEILKKKSVINLIKKAVKAGKKNPTTDQLLTLARATDDVESYKFVKGSTVSDLAAIKTCIAVVNGEAPKEISNQLGTLFGMVGEKETTISSDAQNKIYDVKKTEPTTEEQKDIHERNENEDKHPDTSDRKTEKAAVDEPLKEKTDPAFKKVLDAGEKDPVEKRAAKKTAAGTTIVGTTIKNVRPMTKKELDDQMWSSMYPIPVLELDDGSILFSSSDSEGNSPGAIFGSTSDGEGFTVIASAVEKRAAKKTAGYKESEIAQLLPVDRYGVNVQLRSGDKKTKWMILDEELLNAINDKKDELIFKGDPVEKRAAKKTADSNSTSIYCTMFGCSNNDGGRCTSDAIDVAPEGGSNPVCISYQPGLEASLEVSASEIDKYANRISKGENPKNVLSSFVDGIKDKFRVRRAKKKMAEMQPGEQVQINDPAAGPVTLTVESVGTMMGTGEMAMVGKNEAGESVVIPAGTEMSQVVPTTVS